jgi:hypothetical protein
MTNEEMQQSWAQISALNEELKSAGAWVFAGALHPPDTATVVQIPLPLRAHLVHLRHRAASRDRERGNRVGSGDE